MEQFAETFDPTDLLLFQPPEEPQWKQVQHALPPPARVNMIPDTLVAWELSRVGHVGGYWVGK